MAGNLKEEQARIAELETSANEVRWPLLASLFLHEANKSLLDVAALFSTKSKARLVRSIR
jgi:hypothetical protein